MNPAVDVALGVVGQRIGAAAPCPWIFAYIVICSETIEYAWFSDRFMTTPYGSRMTTL
jgi:hypothetical protein